MSEQKINLSSLNNNVIPDDKFIEELENYTPKISEDIIRNICEEKGFNSQDSRVIRLIAISAQAFLEEIVSGTAESIISKKNNNKFLEGKELNEILKEKGINSNRSQFYCDNLNINLDKK